MLTTIKPVLRQMSQTQGAISF